MEVDRQQRTCCIHSASSASSCTPSSRSSFVVQADDHATPRPDPPAPSSPITHSPAPSAACVGDLHKRCCKAEGRQGDRTRRRVSPRAHSARWSPACRVSIPPEVAGNHRAPRPDGRRAPYGREGLGHITPHRRMRGFSSADGGRWQAGAGTFLTRAKVYSLRYVSLHVCDARGERPGVEPGSRTGHGVA